MKDAFFLSKCKHTIQDEELKITGTYPNYRARFAFPPIKDKRLIFIRAFNDQEEYLSSVLSYKDINIANNRNINLKGLQKTIGITSYNFIDDVTIEFYLEGNERPKNYPDINSDLVPANRYFVDYVVDPGACPICNGKGVACDLQVNDLGRITMITGTEKLRQRVLKALLTQLGTQPYTPTFGSELDSLVGQPIVSDFSRMGINKTVSDCIYNLIKMQDAELPSSERIVKISDISIEYSAEKAPDIINVKVTVQNADGDEVAVYRSFSINTEADIVGN